MIGDLVWFAPLVGLIVLVIGLAGWSLFQGARDRAAIRRRRRDRIARQQARYEARRRMRPVREELDGASLHQAADFFALPYPRSRA